MSDGRLVELTTLNSASNHYLSLSVDCALCLFATPAKVCDELETRLQKGAHTLAQGSEQQQRAANSDGTVAAPQPQVHAATRSAG